ncbi:MATE family efflux transporter, partial [Parabacteroides distasonis]|nr:MATE family efflux transporter [Parabacteroides distasonis]
QIIFLLPLIVVLPMFLGIEGVMYSAPVADLMAALLALVFVTRELRRMRGMEEEMNCGAETAD